MNSDWVAENYSKVQAKQIVFLEKKKTRQIAIYVCGEWNFYLQNELKNKKL